MRTFHVIGLAAIAFASGGCSLLVDTAGLVGGGDDPGGSAPGGTMDAGVVATAHGPGDASPAPPIEAGADVDPVTEDGGIDATPPSPSPSPSPDAGFDAGGDAGAADAAIDASPPDTGAPTCNGVNDATIPPGTNYVQNSTFESGVSGWDPNNAALSQAQGGHCGSYAVLVTYRSTASDGYSLDDQGASVASAPIGATFHGQAWFRSNVTGQSVQLVVRERSTTNVVLNARSATVPLTTAWQRLTIDLTTTYDGSAVDIYAIGSGNVDLLADDVTLVRTQ